MRQQLMCQWDHLRSAPSRGAATAAALGGGPAQGRGRKVDMSAHKPGMVIDGVQSPASGGPHSGDSAPQEATMLCATSPAARAARSGMTTERDVP